MKTLLPKNSALLVIDMQKDFSMLTGALPVPRAEEIIPIVNRWVGHFLEDELPVYYTRDWHPEDHCSFKSESNPDGWPKHCVKNTSGAGLHPDLRIVSTWSMNVLKGTFEDEEQYSAMDGSCYDGITLTEALFDHDIRILYVAGVATEFCVKETVLEALNRTFRVKLIIDAIRAVDVNAGFTALGVMVDAGATVI